MNSIRSCLKSHSYSGRGSSITEKLTTETEVCRGKQCFERRNALISPSKMPSPLSFTSRPYSFFENHISFISFDPFSRTASTFSRFSLRIRSCESFVDHLKTDRVSGQLARVITRTSRRQNRSVAKNAFGMAGGRRSWRRRREQARLSIFEIGIHYADRCIEPSASSNAGRL